MFSSMPVEVVYVFAATLAALAALAGLFVYAEVANRREHKRMQKDIETFQWMIEVETSLQFTSAMNRAVDDVAAYEARVEAEQRAA